MDICSRNGSEPHSTGVRPLRGIGILRASAIIHNAIRDTLAGIQVKISLPEDLIAQMYVSYSTLTIAETILGTLLNDVRGANRPGFLIAWVYMEEEKTVFATMVMRES